MLLLSAGAPPCSDWSPLACCHGRYGYDYNCSTNTPKAACLTVDDWRSKPRPAREIDLRNATTLLQTPPPYFRDKQSVAVWGEFSAADGQRHQIWFDVRPPEPQINSPASR